MWPFKKKLEKSEPIIIETVKPKECGHVWRDFDWYLVSEWHDYTNRPKYGYYRFKIIEPYVCCLCKIRENHVIDREYAENVTEEDFHAKQNEIKEKYKEHLKDRAVVEDQIRDMQKNIDREFLETLSTYFPQKVGISTPLKMKL